MQTIRRKAQAGSKTDVRKLDFKIKRETNETTLEADQEQLLTKAGTQK